MTPSSGTPKADNTPSRWQRRLDAIARGEQVRPPFAETLHMPGIHEWGPGFVVSHVEITPSVFNSGGSVFGGYLACVADQVASQAVYSVLDDDHSLRTVSLQTEYLRPVPAGLLVVTARVRTKQRTLARVQVEMTVDDEIHCEARALVMLRPTAHDLEANHATGAAASTPAGSRNSAVSDPTGCAGA
ncbi:PaaI family thioesterase [Gordonia sp. CPCC 206044]|uniref:PaaI family thioesterase n=1 Tax=Gordonia sp. CPCC 206044 TaxID=3140793 RepID=UPI003AF3320A